MIPASDTCRLMGFILTKLNKGLSVKPRKIIRHHSFLALSVFTICLGLMGCSPHLGRSIIVNDIPPSSASSYRPASWRGLTVVLDTTVIALSKQPGAKIDGRFVPIEGAIDSVVGQGLRQRLRSAGASVRQGGSVALTSRVTEWGMRVYPDFPSTSVEARAVIVIEALHASGEILYRATYTGEATRSGVNVRAPQIEETLINAMAHALDEVVMDDRLRRAVESAKE